MTQPESDKFAKEIGITVSLAQLADELGTDIETAAGFANWPSAVVRGDVGAVVWTQHEADEIKRIWRDEALKAVRESTPPELDA